MRNLKFCVVFWCVVFGGLVQASEVLRMQDTRLALSVEKRIAYQRAIEEVYWKHTIWPDTNPGTKPALASVVSQREIRSKVYGYLKKSYALAYYWNRSITAEQMQAEMDRMARETKDPAVLQELFNVLGNDPYVIAECLARPILVEYLSEQVQGFENWLASLNKQEAMLVDIAAFKYHMPKINNTFGVSPFEATASDSWGPIATKGAPSSLSYHTTVWTGIEMIVWGGDQIGGRYNPSTNSWKRVSKTGAPSGRSLQTAIWTGTEMIIWGGSVAEEIAFLNTGGRYNPLTNSWSPTTVTGAPIGRRRHTAIWTGKEMIVWGGYTYDARGNEGSVKTGGRYNPSTDSWRPTATKGAPSARRMHTAVWTGKRMIVWGGDNFTIGALKLNTGGIYNPSNNSWKPTTTEGAPTGGTSNHKAIWTGTEMIVWGDLDIRHDGFGLTAGRYDPSKNTWAAMSSDGDPASRYGHTLVWTGSEMIVWGGDIEPPNIPDPVNTGGIYDPSTDSWRATTLTGVPAEREGHSAVWTGTRMIIWGGVGKKGFRSGAHYTP